VVEDEFRHRTSTATKAVLDNILNELIKEMLSDLRKAR
jgi:hypothetical protein